MSTKYNMIRDINSYNGFGLPFAADGKTGKLAAGVEQHITVPSNYEWWVAKFNFRVGDKVWVDNITTAAAPSGAFSASTSEMNPDARLVKGGSTLSFITSDTTAEVGVQFYALNLNGIGSN